MIDNKPKIKNRRRLNPLTDDAYFQALIFASEGRSDRFIQQRTGLSTGQISYRLKQYEIRRADYRDGTSPMAVAVEREMDSILTGILTRHVKTVDRTR